MPKQFDKLLHRLLAGTNKVGKLVASDTKGFVETLNIHDATGWAASSAGAELKLSARLHNITYPLDVTWHERADVAEQLGQRGIRPGFFATFPFELRQALSSELEAIDKLQLYCNGKKLSPSSAISIRRPTSVRAKSRSVLPQPADFSTGDLVGYVEQIEGFTIHLKIESGGYDSPHPYIVCGGERLDCSSAFVPKKDSDNQAGTLEIELPGYLWEHAEEDGKVRLRIQLGEYLIPQEPLLLERTHAVGWLNDIVFGFFGEEQYWTLLGLEHLHFLGDEGALLDAQGKAFFADQAARFGLDEYLEDKLSQTPSEEAREKSSRNTLSLWQALRDFNAKLPDYKESESHLLELTLERFRQEPEQQRWLIYSLTPFFCRIRQFPAMQNRLSPLQVEELASAKDDWRCTLALPFLVASGDLERAAEVLYRLPDTEKFWLNTECIVDATKLAIAMTPKNSGIASLENYAYALIHLLDSMTADYWSRLHDELLLESLACWFDSIDQHSTWLREDLCKAVIRIYGLNPLTWPRLQPPMHSHTQLLSPLHMAKRRFDILQNVLENRSLWPSQAQSAFDALTYFRQHGNKDADAATRELSCNMLSQANAHVEDGDPLAMLSAPDFLRLAAYPATGIATSLPEHQQFVLLQMQMTGITEYSAYYPLQQEARHALRALQRLIDDDRENDVTVALNNIKELASRLRGKENQFLSWDILSDANLRVTLAGRTEQQLLELMGEHSKEALQATQDYLHPPASLLNALRNLQSAQQAAPTPVQQALIEKLSPVLQRTDETAQAALQLPDSPLLKSRPEIDNGDTLVVIYSCRKYLDTRIPAIRATWVQDLIQRGIPYVVMVGDGDDTLEGDVLALDVSDRYENLPQKTLKLFDWIRRNTDFQYAIKIDDDCYLDVERYFDSSSHRKLHYYGRVLHRSVGNMDRTWHQDKSQGQRAKRALDKSPEPSAYADGSTGYCLSRLAMEVLHQVTLTTEGKRLISSSYMEDKMLGDLLRMANIHCSNEDFYTCIRRRTFSTASTIAMWEGTFLPGGLTPTKVAHLDTDADMASVHARKRDAEVLPKRIWPTYEEPSLHYNKNQLELLSPVDKTRELLAQDLLVIVVVRNEMQMLPHFLEHYRKLGVRAFVFVDNASDDGTRESLLAEPDVVLYSADTEYRNSHYGVAWQQAVLGNHCVGKWALIADADELLVYPDCENRSIHSLIEQIEQQGYDSARIFMIDMYPYGDLEDANFDQQTPFSAAGYFDEKPLLRWRLGGGYYSNTPNYTSALRHRLVDAAEPNAFMSQKYALLKYQPWMRLNQGLHNVGSINPMESDMSFAHFKYHAGFKRKIEIEILRKQHFDGAKEYRKYRELLAESSGGFGQPGISAQYQDSSSFNGLSRIDSRHE